MTNVDDKLLGANPSAEEEGCLLKGNDGSLEANWSYFWSLAVLYGRVHEPGWHVGIDGLQGWWGPGYNYVHFSSLLM